MLVNPIGSTIALDRYGNPVDLSGSLAERYTFLGVAWRLCFGRTELASAGIYASISFRTPDSGLILLASAAAEKTGNEVEFHLVEGGTYAGGTVKAPINPNRFIVATYNPTAPITDCYIGVSPTATLTGGTTIANALLPGDAQGNVKPGGASAMEPFILAKSTVYTLKFTAVSTAYVAARAVMAYLRSAG